MNKEELFYETYKPLKNALCKLKTDESLLIIWNYTAFLHGRNPLFTDIETSREYMNLDYIQKRRSMSECELELLTREVTLHSEENPHMPKTLRKLDYLAGCINKIKSIDGKIAELYINTDNILLELHRLGHRQFPWQLKNPSTEYFTRYYKIFSEPSLAKLVNDSVGVPIRDFYIIASLLWGFFLDRVALNYPPRIEVSEITLEKLDAFISHLSCGLDEYRNKVKEGQELNEKFNYTPNIGRYFPIIRMNYFGVDSLVCPDSTLFFWRVTDGLYYEIYNLTDFGNNFGSSFQKYVGDVLEKACKKLKYFEENKYGSRHNEKDSVDWIVEDESCVLFIECKTKRMLEKSRVELFDISKLDEDLGKMAGFVVQTYINIKEYREGNYPHYPFDKDKKIFPMVVTLENWLLYGKLLEKLDILIKEKMQENNISLEWLKEMPYCICAVDEFEEFIQIADKKGICEVLNGKLFDSEKRLWTLDVYLHNQFKEEKDATAFLFDDDFKNILPARAY